MPLAQAGLHGELEEGGDVQVPTVFF